MPDLVIILVLLLFFFLAEDESLSRARLLKLHGNMGQTVSCWVLLSCPILGLGILSFDIFKETDVNILLLALRCAGVFPAVNYSSGRSG